MMQIRFRSLVLGALVLLSPLGVNAGERASSPMPYPSMPEAVSSFGATVCDGYLYQFSGHVGRIPGNSIDGLSPHFCRIRIDNPAAEWESLPMHVASQSPGLVAWNGNVYRVGGLSFRNKLGEPTEHHSLDVFAKYDPRAKKWTDLPALPAPRSSLDAAVVDGRLYVVGGWNLQENGPTGAVWHEDVWVFDLAREDRTWKPVAKPPFVTRALAAASYRGKLYVMGGMSSDNKITRNVHVYDPAGDAWSEGPPLPENDRFSGFAISAFAANNRLYYSGSGGVVYRLSDDGRKWESVERLLFPRSFHRLVADGSKVILLGGVARGGGYLANVEFIDVARSSTAAKAVEWSF